VIKSSRNLAARIAQSVEQRTENPRVGGSIPSPGMFYIEPFGFSRLGRRAVRKRSKWVGDESLRLKGRLARRARMREVVEGTLTMGLHGITIYRR
jgi:hypothetical protein